MKFSDRSAEIARRQVRVILLRERHAVVTEQISNQRHRNSHLCEMRTERVAQPMNADTFEPAAVHE